MVVEYDVGDYEVGLDRALEMIDYSGFEGRRAASAKQGQLRGIGLSTYVEACGFGPSQILAKLGAGAGACPLL